MNTENDSIFFPAYGPATGRGEVITLNFIGEALLVAADDQLPEHSMLELLGSPQHSLAIGTAATRCKCGLRVPNFRRG